MKIGVLCPIVSLVSIQRSKVFMWESQVLFPALPVPSGVLSVVLFNKVHSGKDPKLIKMSVAYSLEINVM